MEAPEFGCAAPQLPAAPAGWGPPPTPLPGPLPKSFRALGDGKGWLTWGTLRTPSHCGCLGEGGWPRVSAHPSLHARLRDPGFLGPGLLGLLLPPPQTLASLLFPCSAGPSLCDLCAHGWGLLPRPPHPGRATESPHLLRSGRAPVAQLSILHRVKDLGWAAPNGDPFVQSYAPISGL